MYYIGIDIGSTASKVVVLDEKKKNILDSIILPTGWNARETSDNILDWINDKCEGERRIVATGYGRVSVPYADKTVTEITCHGKGAYFLYGKDATIIDIGGQDTKVIVMEEGRVTDFKMNDKCSAGTGKFLEVMANRLALTLNEMFEYAQRGEKIQLSAMCTVFAESEVISMLGNGVSRENICSGVINSICTKVVSLASKKASESYFLTGGFCRSEYIINELSSLLEAEIFTHKDARLAGAIGAALLG